MTAAVNWAALGPGEHQTACPSCARSERDKSLGVTVEGGRGVARCFRREYVEIGRRECIVTQDLWTASFGTEVELEEWLDRIDRRLA